MKLLRVLYTLPNFDTAGSGRALLHIARRLDRRAFAPSICVERRVGNAIEQEVEALGIPLLEAAFTVPARPLPGLPGRCRRAARDLRGFDVWHSFHYLDDYTEPLVASKAGARWIYTKKNMSWNRRSWWLRSLFARRIAVQNRDMMERFFDRPWLRRRAVLLPRGVDVDHFRPDGPGWPELRVDAAAGALLVTCVAHLVPVKGHPTLLEAAARVPKVHLLVAGRELDRGYVSDLKRQAAELGIEERVRWLGPVTEVDRLLREADVFVLPTLGRGRMEGCPVALLEAMACGRPCVATDVPGSRDLLATEDVGLRVPPEDPTALARALERLADDADLRRHLGGAARRRAEESFPLSLEVARHEALYREVADR